MFWCGNFHSWVTKICEPHVKFYSHEGSHALIRILKTRGINKYYYTLYSKSVFSLAKNLQLILKISATHSLVSYLIADN